MKAAVCRRFGEPLVIEELDLAAPGPGEVKVAIKACAICHSDIFFLDGAWGGTLPAVYGHEAAGIVEALGEGVSDLKAGDHVVVTLIRSCGHCHYCGRGEEVLCESEFALDRKGPLTGPDGEAVKQGLRTGAFAEAVVVERSQVAAIPKSIPFEAASLIACGGLTGFGAVVNTADVKPGASVVVIGAGGVGLNSIQAARIVGAAPLIAIDVLDRKLAAARRFGAGDTVNARDEEAVARVRELTHGRGADYVFVTVGSGAVVDQAFGMLSRGGRLVLVGMPPSGVTATMDPGNIANDSQIVLGSKMGSSRVKIDVPKLVDLYQRGELLLDELVSGRYPLERINEAVASSRSGTALRNVIVF
ncbi:MAG: Zn-dependent alcohol dehydrogenase [Parvibaculaceae bacterium]